MMNDRTTVANNGFDNLRTLLAATSEGPWMPIPDPETENFSKFSSPSGVIFGDDILPADAAFSAAAHNELPALLARLDEVTAERDALAAVIERAKSSADVLAPGNYAEDDFAGGAHMVAAHLDAAPSPVLAAHDAKVRAEALREAADVFWNRRPTGQAYNGYAVAEELRDLAAKEENR